VNEGTGGECKGAAGKVTCRESYCQGLGCICQSTPWTFFRDWFGVLSAGTLPRETVIDL